MIRHFLRIGSMFLILQELIKTQVTKPNSHRNPSRTTNPWIETQEHNI